MSEKTSFVNFMLSPEFQNFNNVKDTTPNDSKLIFADWSDERLISTVNKLVRELLRRDTHGRDHDAFIETNEELHLHLYVLTSYLKSRIQVETS